MAYKVKFDTGHEVEFQNQPTQQDIEEAFRQITGGQITTPTTPAKQIQQPQDIATGLVLGGLKGAGSTLLSGIQNLGTIIGGTGAAIFARSEEQKKKEQADLYDQLLKQGKIAEARELAQKIQNRGIMGGLEQIAESPLYTKAKEALAPKTIAEKIGYGVEKVGEFLIPSSLISKKTAGMTKAGKALTEAGATGLITLAQNDIGQTPQQAKQALTRAGITSATSLFLSGLTEGLKSLGSKIQLSTIKPSKADVADGFKIENIDKYNLGGNLTQTLVKSNDQLNKYRNELRTILKESDGKVDLNKILQDVGNDLNKMKTKNFGESLKIKNAFQEMFDELVYVTDGKAKIDLLTANDLKIGAGAQGAWQYGKPDIDSVAKEKVYNLLYSKIKKAIEKASGSGKVAELNKAMSEIIPIRNAVLRRIPIAQRQNPIGLLDGVIMLETLTTENPRGLALLGARMITGSAKAGAGMKQIASGLEKAKLPTTGLLSQFLK